MRDRAAGAGVSGCILHASGVENSSFPMYCFNVLMSGTLCLQPSSSDS